MVTTYEYDEESGRLVRAITVRESEWLEDDREWAQAQEEEERGKCPGCKLPLDETTDPTNAGAYEASHPIRCAACAARGNRQHEHRNDADPHGLLYPVRKVGSAPLAARTDPNADGDGGDYYAE
ncbi:hypothetical protein [Nonomuraea sp. bgisy101]|uniref:hypothetical protein n=1 Tax=Nonomuraea sp. bgisy101 TaxID=3413784 RepID=UPI003D74E195